MITVAVLAGGAGRRLGGAKPAADLGGRPLIAWPLGAAAAAGLPVVVVAKVDSPLPALDAEIVFEPDEPRHPLAGIVHAIEHAGEIVALGCDMPFVTADALRALAAAPSPAGPEPLLARYGPAQLVALRGALAAEQPLRAAFAALAPVPVAVDPRCLHNVNTRAELKAAASELLGPA